MVCLKWTEKNEFIKSFIYVNKKTILYLDRVLRFKHMTYPIHNNYVLQVVKNGTWTSFGAITSNKVNTD